MRTNLTRRELFGHAMAAAAAVPVVAEMQSTQELPYYVDLPANASLWGYVCFLGEQEIEIFVAGRNTSTIRGRFKGKRLQEFEYENPKRIAQRVSITARRVGEDGLLTYTQFAFVGHGNPMVSYGFRALPQDLSGRAGVYSYEAIVTAFTSYD
jgi:hypothetical protein